MAVPIDLQEISGAAELRDWFGYWPMFHDAEIISLHLNRLLIADPGYADGGSITDRHCSRKRSFIKRCSRGL